MIEQILPLIGFILGTFVTYIILKNYHKKNIDILKKEGSKEIQEKNIVLEANLKNNEKTISDLKDQNLRIIQENGK